MTEFASVKLGEHHLLDEFDCDVPSLNRWLVTQAVTAKRAGTAKTYVWEAVGSDRVIAYYAITPRQVRGEDVPRKLSGALAVIPAYLLGRLALDKSLHGQGLGAQLLRDALEVIVSAADLAAGRLIVVDADNNDVAAFYQKYDFRAVETNPLRLFLKIETARKALGG